MNRTVTVAALVVLGILFVALAIVYFVEPASSLPSFFPGHVGSSASAADRHHHHAKHGIAAIVVGLACFAVAWFRSAPGKEVASPAA
jgi:hypothetical protein